MEKLEMYDEKFGSVIKVGYYKENEVPLGIYQLLDKEESVIVFTKEEAVALYRFLGEVLK